MVEAFLSGTAVAVAYLVKPSMVVKMYISPPSARCKGPTVSQYRTSPFLD